MPSVMKLIGDGQTCSSHSMDMWNKGLLCIFSRMKTRVRESKVDSAA